jgi:hypothetical protein
MSFPRNDRTLGRTMDLVVFADPITSAALSERMPQNDGLGWIAAAIGVVSQIIPMFGPHPDPNSASQIMSRMAAGATSAGNDNARNDYVAHLIGAYRNPSNGYWLDQTDGTHVMPDQALIRVHEILEHGSTGDFYPSPDQYNALAQLAVAAGVAQATAGGVPQGQPGATNPLSAIANLLNPTPTAPRTPSPYGTAPYGTPVTTAGLSGSTMALGLIGALIVGGILLSDRKGRRR